LPCRQQACGLDRDATRAGGADADADPADNTAATDPPENATLAG